MPLKVQYFQLRSMFWLVAMIDDCHLLAWDKRPFWAAFVEAVKGQGDEKTFHTSLLLCDQKWPDLSLAMSTNLGKVCEDFIMNQTMILENLLFPIVDANRVQSKTPLWYSPLHTTDYYI